MPPRFRWLAALALLAGPLHAGPAPAGERSLLVPFAELRVLRDVARSGLDQLVRRDPSDDAAAWFSGAGTETRVEWRTLRVSGIHELETTAADARDGITRRIRCTLRARAHRVWQSEVRAWSPWIAGSHLAFPTHIEVVRSGHGWQAVVPGGTPFRPLPASRPAALPVARAGHQDPAPR
jgi:hypothetical protein